MIRTIAVLFIVCGLFTRAFLMKDVLFYDWDEGIYAEVASSLAENSDIQTRFNGQVWFNKPPLSHYMLSLAFRLIPDPELAGRITMAVIAAVMFVFLYLLTSRIVKYFFKKASDTMPRWEYETGLLLPALLTFSTPIILERGTQLNTDVMLAIFWLGYFLSESSYWGRLISLTLGSLTKSLLGLYPLAFEILIHWRSMLKPQRVLALLGMAVVPLSWHFLNYFVYGQKFVSSHLMDQLVKRVTDPIELHYGGKLYYMKLAWENLNVFSLIIVFGFTVVAWHALKVSKNKMNIGKYVGTVQSLVRSDDWPKYLALCAGAPFFIFLSFVQSKISWYFATVLPFLTLPVAYLFFSISSAPVRRLLALSVIVYWLYMFVPATYGFKPLTRNESDFIQVARCTARLSVSNTSVLVNAQERQNRNVLEAAQQQTDTSFIYGGSPSFVYYAQKPVQYYYKPEEFLKAEHSDAALVISQGDELAVQEVLLNSSPVTECQYGEWKVFIAE